MPQQGEVFRSVILAHSAVILVKGQVQGPVQLILNAPMRAHTPQHLFSAGDTGDVVTVFATLFGPDPSLRADPRFRAQVFPVLIAAQMAQDLRVGNRPAFADLDPSMSLIDRL